MKGFISYAHEDYDAYEAFCRAVEPAARCLGVEFWADPLLHTGQAWNGEIAKAVAAADVFVALVSVESLYSSYISKQELPAMQNRSSAIRFQRHGPCRFVAARRAHRAAIARSQDDTGQ